MITPRELKYGKTALKKAFKRLAGLKTGRAVALEEEAKGLGSLLEAGWITEQQAVSALLRVSSINGLLRDDGERAVRANIRDGLAWGRKRPLPLIEFASWDDSNIPNTPAPNRRSKADRLVGAVRTAVWKEANRDWYNDYQRRYMRRWRAKRVKLAK